MKRIVALIGLMLLSGCIKGIQAQTWMANHTAYVHGYWHSAFEPLPMKKTLSMNRFSDSVPPTTPTDVYVLGQLGSTSFSYGVTNNYDIGACVERELHDGQWLAGGCKDVLYLLHADSAGNVNKFMHLGGAVMSNAEHGNTTYQIKAGLDLNALGTLTSNGLNLIAPNLNINVPPWVSHVGNAITLDGTFGYRPVHDASVNGNLTYGIMAMVNVPIATTFEWLISGM